MVTNKSTTTRPTTIRGVLIGSLLVVTAMVGMVGYKNSSLHEQPLDVMLPIDPVTDHTMNLASSRTIPSDLSYTVSLADPHTTLMGFHPELYVPDMMMSVIMTETQLLQYGQSNIPECVITDVVGKSIEDISYGVLLCEITHSN